MNDKPVCVISAPVFSRSGYGDWSMEIAKSILRHDKYKLIVVPMRWGHCPNKMTAKELGNDAEALKLFDCILKAPLTRQPDLFVQISIPNEFKPIGKYNIGLTAGIETTIPVGSWIEGLNRMDVNFVLSKFTKDVLTKAEYKKNFNDGHTEPLKSIKPMEILFWGADTSIYKKTNDKIQTLEKEMGQIKEDFCFLFVGQWTHSNGLYNDRKDIGNLIKTFYRAFKNSKIKPALILKTSGVSFSKMDKYDMLAKINAIKNEVGDDEELPNVYLLHGDLTNEEMNALFNHEKVKVHITFTHGEGFGYPLLLASLSGKPIMAPNWSGYLDFLDEKYTTLLKGEVKQISPESVNDYYIKESGWYFTNYDSAFAQMRNAIKKYDELLVNAEKLRIQNEQKFNLQSMDLIFHDLLKKYVPEFAVEKKIVLPSLRRPELPKLNKVEPTKVELPTS